MIHFARREHQKSMELLDEMENTEDPWIKKEPFQG